jgi:hypothetical protein
VHYKPEEFLRSLEATVSLTSVGEVVLLTNHGTAEEAVIACLVAQHLAHKAGRTNKETLSVDDLIAAGGLAHALARQTVYNATSRLSRNRIVQKLGNEFFVDERIVLQYVAKKFPQYLNSQNVRALPERSDP